MKKSPEANPHHVILIADPQIVDPHTYPGRPWPLSALTILHADAYLRKAFASMQRQLMPDTVLFLGDLFDGGREWSTAPTGTGEDHSPDKRWHKYGDAFWLKEYDRFGRIFVEAWLQRRYQRSGQPGRKLIAELPGNHDLGFGSGIRLPVRKRFNAYFGEGNRVDMIGNFTFVHIDSVSLGANGQADPKTGAVGEDSGDERVHQIWQPTEDFLSDIKEQKARVINRELRRQAGLSEIEPQDHSVQELVDIRPPEAAVQTDLGSNIPSILLTHVPLYRVPGTPCGKLREKYPPSVAAPGEDEAVQKDMKNALPVVAGLQYQTVLTPALSHEIIAKVGDIEAVFSGDDHDYCEVSHHGYTSKNGGIKEITLKAMSRTAGVRKPGFLMLSLWNPIDARGIRIQVDDASSDRDLLQTHLCLLPDHLSNFQRYGVLFAVTLVILWAHAWMQVYGSPELPKADQIDLLPTYRSSSPPTGPETTSASLWSAPHGLAARIPPVGRMRSADPENGFSKGSSDGYALPAPDAPGGGGINDSGRGVAFHDRGGWNEIVLHDESKQKTTKGLPAVIAKWRANLQRIAIVVVMWYLWLTWTT